MLDRLRLGLVSLPDSTYDLVLLLSDVEGSRSESKLLLDRQVLIALVRALKPGGRLKSQDGSYAALEGEERTEAILAGLFSDEGAERGGGLVKPDTTTVQSIPLKLGKKVAAENMVNKVNGKRKSIDEVGDSRPAGVGFSDDLDQLFDEDGLEDDELIDEDDLLTEADKTRSINPRKASLFDIPIIVSPLGSCQG